MTASEVPVSATLQADVSLQGDGARDLFVFDLAQLGIGYPAGLLGRARVEQALRSQQASDGIGPKRWQLILHSMIPDVTARSQHKPAARPNKKAGL